MWDWDQNSGDDLVGEYTHEIETLPLDGVVAENNIKEVTDMKKLAAAMEELGTHLWSRQAATVGRSPRVPMWEQALHKDHGTTLAISM